MINKDVDNGIKEERIELTNIGDKELNITS